jgi:hypothetical protein
MTPVASSMCKPIAKHIRWRLQVFAGDLEKGAHHIS